MTKNNLKLLDCDEHNRNYFERVHADLIAVAKDYDFVVDLATSDVVIYVDNQHGESFALTW